MEADWKIADANHLPRWRWKIGGDLFDVFDEISSMYKNEEHLSSTKQGTITLTNANYWP